MKIPPLTLPKNRHALALVVSLAVLVAMFAASASIFRWIEKPYMGHLLALPFAEKNQGVYLQREAFLRPDVLPVYGSSELVEEMGFRADQVFWHKPKGFQVCPIGMGGNTTMLMAEKIAALGDAVEGRKVAILLSPEWFRDTRPRADHVAGNFSPLQAIGMLLNDDLDPAMKRRFAGQMLRYPDSLKDHPHIKKQLQGLAAGRAQGWRSWPASWRLKARSVSLTWEDHFETLLAMYDYEVDERGEWRMKPKKLALKKRIERLELQSAKAGDTQDAEDERPPVPAGPKAEESLPAMKASGEWEDFALLLDTLKALGAKPVIISMPMPEEFSKGRVITPETRAYYYARVESMSRERGFPVVTFADHDADKEFLVGNTSHPTVKGWLYIDHVLDEFFHGRITAL